MTCRTATLLCAILLLGACGKSDDQPAPKLFKDQIETLDKAKTVEETLQKQNEEQRKMIEQQAQ
jgi:major membrane immunogen (membrane-anchored lipoprotein)